MQESEFLNESLFKIEVGFASTPLFLLTVPKCNRLGARRVVFTLRCLRLRNRFGSSKPKVYPIAEPSSEGQPNAHDCDGTDNAGRPFRLGRRFFPGSHHHLRWDQPQNKSDSCRDEDKVVQIADHWNEIRDEIDGAQGVCHDADGQSLRKPGGLRIANRYRERDEVSL